MSFIHTFLCSTVLLTAFASSVSLLEPDVVTAPIAESYPAGVTAEDELACRADTTADTPADASMTRRSATKDAYGLDSAEGGLSPLVLSRR